MQNLLSIRIIVGQLAAQLSFAQSRHSVRRESLHHRHCLLRGETMVQCIGFTVCLFVFRKLPRTKTWK